MTTKHYNILLRCLFTKVAVLFQEEESLAGTVLSLENGSGLEILGEHSSAFGKTLVTAVIGGLVEDEVKQRPLCLFTWWIVFGFDILMYLNNHHSKST